MAAIVKKACAGTMESSDAYVEVEPAAEAELTVESAVYERFGQAIHAAAEEVLREWNVTNAKVRIVDQGALDCVIRARVETALRRGMEADR